jgi:two-component system, NarL family, response regulator LiaR
MVDAETIDLDAGLMRSRHRREAPLLIRTGSSASNQTIRIVTVDPYPVVRQGLQAVFHEEDGFAVVGEADNGPDAMEQARALHPDFVLVNLVLHGMSGLESIALIRRELPYVKVMVWGGTGDLVEVMAALQAGAVGYLILEAGGDELRNALRAAAAGHVVVAPEVASHLLGDVSPSVLPQRLTKRELVVLRGMVRGMANKEIARDLHLSPETVKVHVSRILRKLEVQTRAQAVIRAVTHRLLLL